MTLPLEEWQKVLIPGGERRFLEVDFGENLMKTHKSQMQLLHTNLIIESRLTSNIANQTVYVTAVSREQNSGKVLRYGKPFEITICADRSDLSDKLQVSLKNRIADIDQV